MFWLFKEEPDDYSFSDLMKEGRTTWSGVRNNLALKHLRSVKKGDQIFFYHTGKEKQIVGTMRALTDAYSQTKKKGVDLESKKEIAVDVAPEEELSSPVTLASIKSDGRFADFPLVKISRLSVMPVTSEQWSLIRSGSVGRKSKDR
jgi:predicted RNA-binding protein with PUA-like domain